MEEKSRLPAAAILGLLVAIGLAVAGYFIGNTLYNGRLASNTVTVKGFAERDVKADLALWQISYSLAGGNLAQLYAQSSASEKTLVDFLVQKGFQRTDIKPGNLELEDLLANQYRANGVTADKRYILKNTISVRSTDVTRVDSSTRQLNDLISQGIVLTANSADFQFTKLNDIKSAMLRDATKNARDAAQQFANDADSTVGSIQSANQGFFSVGSRDSAAAQGQGGGEGYTPPQQSTIDKKVRVVVTLTYYLNR
jgi:hypothetical protein